MTHSDRSSTPPRSPSVDHPRSTSLTHDPQGHSGASVIFKSPEEQRRETSRELTGAISQSWDILIALYPEDFGVDVADVEAPEYVAREPQSWSAVCHAIKRMRAGQTSAYVRPSLSGRQLTDEPVVQILSPHERLYLYQRARASYLYHHHQNDVSPSEQLPRAPPLRDQISKMIGSLHSGARTFFLRRNRRPLMSFVLGMIMMLSVNDTLDGPLDDRLEETPSLTFTSNRRASKITQDARSAQKSEQSTEERYVKLDHEGGPQSHLRNTEHHQVVNRKATRSKVIRRQVARRKTVRHEQVQTRSRVEVTSPSIPIPSEALSDSGALSISSGMNAPLSYPHSRVARGSSRTLSTRSAKPAHELIQRQKSKTPQPIASSTSVRKSQVHQLRRMSALWDQGERRRALMTLTRTLERELRRRDPVDWTQIERQALARALKWAQTLQEDEALSTLRAMRNQLRRSSP